MLALQYQGQTAITLVDAPLPEAHEGEVILDVVVAGICGTDLKIVRGEHRLYPAGTIRIPGHEFIGRVRENRSGRSELAPGRMVAVAPNINCGDCAPCRRGLTNLCVNYEAIGLTIGGAFAQSVRMPRRAVEQGNLIPLPVELDPAVAVLMEPLAAVYRGFRALELKAGDSLVVLGAGPVGLIAVILAGQIGVSPIIVSQSSSARRELAATFGAHFTIDPRAENLREQVLARTAGAGADCVLVATPVASLYPESLRLAGVGGRVNFFAGLPNGKGEVPLDANLLHYREIRVTGTTANSTADCVNALAMLAGNPAAYLPLITHRFPLSEAVEAFRIAAAGEAIKVVLQP